MASAGYPSSSSNARVSAPRGWAGARRGRWRSSTRIEERIDAVLRQKRDLSDTILSQADGPVRSGLTTAELLALFGIQPANRLAA